MRFPALSNVASLTLVTAGATAGASPAPNHNHQHLHAVKRSEVYKTVDIVGPTIVAFVLEGKIVGKKEVCEGIERGNLRWKDPNNGPSECSFSSTGTTAAPTATTTAAQVALPQSSVVVQQKQDIKAVPIQAFEAPDSSGAPECTEATKSSEAPESTEAPKSTEAPEPSEAPESTEAPNSTKAPEPSVKQASSTTSQTSTASPESLTPDTSSDSAPTVSSTAAGLASTETSSPQSNNITAGQGLDLEFPDGEIDCSTFPSEYGPIEVEWANLGGWAGIQYVTVEGDSVTHIVTAVAGGKGCIPGAMCSYACPPGYQKSQWPSTQGATGQSVGGIECNANGKLSLTNPDLSKNLCIQGTGATHVQNKLSYNAAICRTDYPGT